MSLVWTWLRVAVALGGVVIGSQSFVVAPASELGRAPPNLADRDHMASLAGYTAIRPLAESISGPSLPAATQPAIPLVVPAASGTLRAHELFAFAPYWSLSQEAGFDVHDLSTVAYFGVDVAQDGSIVQSGAGWDGYNSQALVDLVNRAHAAATRVVLTAKNFDSGTLHALSTTPGAADRLAGQLGTAITKKQLDGANLDFEGQGSGDRAGFAQFAARLSQLLHRANRQWQVTIDTYATSATDSAGFFDISSLSGAVDGFFVMAYQGAGADPAPVDPLTGGSGSDTQAVAGYLSVVPASKVILGVPYYGYDWPTASGDLGAAATGAPTPVNYAQVVASKHPEYWDPLGSVPWSSYQDPSGHWHEVYYDDPQSLSMKAQLADLNHLAGLGIWALGMDGNDPAMIGSLLGKASALKLPPVKGGASSQAATPSPPVRPPAVSPPAVPSPSAPPPPATVPPTPKPTPPTPTPATTPTPPPPSPTPTATSTPTPTPTPTPSASASAASTASPTVSAAARASPSPAPSR